MVSVAAIQDVVVMCLITIVILLAYANLVPSVEISARAMETNDIPLASLFQINSIIFLVVSGTIFIIILKSATRRI